MARAVTASNLIPNAGYHGHEGVLVQYLWASDGELMGEIAWNQPYPYPTTPRSLLGTKWLVPNDGEPLVPPNVIEEQP